MALAPDSLTKRLWYAVDIYMPRCLIPALHMIMHSPHISWRILQDYAKMLHISEAYMPLWSWIWVRFFIE